MPVAVITGASSGIGRATAIRFAAEGYSLSLTGRDVKNLEEVVNACIATGSVDKDKVTFFAGDLSDDAVVKGLIEHTLNTLGQIDTLINSAGILTSGPVLECDIDVYDKQMEVNVRNVVKLTRAALPEIIKAKGTIVNVSSITGPCPFPGVAYYCMSKAALDQFTKCLALEMAPLGVRVNAVNPGVIVTSVHLRSGMTEEAYEQFIQKGKDTHALGRVGEPHEVAEAILFLASSRSSFTTGELLRVDGGRGIMHPR
ncbi:unnamed protein product [Auanema sp. JU1783]|nr:unnamed protein product [Auanema sp. JU1783]